MNLYRLLTYQEEQGFERFDNAIRQILTISKKELLRRRAQEKRLRKSKRRPEKA